MQNLKHIVNLMRTMHAMAHAAVLAGNLNVVRNDSNKMVSIINVCYFG